MSPNIPEMVERVARVLEESHLPKGQVWGDHNYLHAYFVRLAHIAIAAMREPTDAMRTAGGEASLADGAHDCEVPMSDVWQAMIDAALGR